MKPTTWRIAVSAALLVLVGCTSEADKREWRLIASSGNSKFLYVSPEGLAERGFLESVLREVYEPHQINDILIFDSRSSTPRQFPMSDDEMLHLKAHYNYNPNNGFERFVFVEITDSAASPPAMRERNASISPRR